MTTLAAVLIVVIVAWRLITPILEWIGGQVLLFILSPWLPKRRRHEWLARLKR